MALKITQLTAGAQPLGADLLETSQHVSTTPISRKITMTQLMAFIATQLPTLPNNQLISTVAGNLRLGSFSGTIDFTTAELTNISTAEISTGSNSAGIVLQIGSIATAATSTPDAIDLGAGYSSTPGANPKLRIFNDSFVMYGLGVSAGSFDYIAPQAGSNHNFYSGGNNVLNLNTTTATLPYGITTPSIKTSTGDLTISPASGGIVLSSAFRQGGASYSTGTISQSGNTITGSGTTFTQGMQGGLIYIVGASTPWAIIRNVRSSTNLNMSSSQTVGAGTTYVIYYGGVQSSDKYVGIGNLTVQAADNLDNIGNFRGSLLNCGTFITPSSLVITSGVNSNQVFATSDTTDANDKYTIGHDSTPSGKGAIIGLGDGTIPQDLFFYRSAASTFLLSSSYGGAADATFTAGEVITSILRPISGSYSIFHQGTAESGYSWTSVEEAIYSTGTVSQSGTTVTGAGTIFTSAMVGGLIVYTDGSGNYGFITALNNALSLTVSTSQSIAPGTTYNILYGGVVATREGDLGAENLYVIGPSAKSILQLDANKKVISTVLTDGQLLIGNTGSVPTAATLTAGSGITITNFSGGITIAAAGAGFTWSVKTTNASLLAENGYISNSASLLTFTLPTTAAVGDTFEVVGSAAGGWIIAQNSGQQINLGSSLTTVGVGGSVASTNRYDAIEIICVAANNSFSIVNAVGNLTIV